MFKVFVVNGLHGSVCYKCHEPTLIQQILSATYFKLSNCSTNAAAIQCPASHGRSDSRVSIAQHDKAPCSLSIKLSAQVCPDLCCRCQLKKNREECIVGMSSSSITLNNCCLQSSGGPAVDMIGTSVLRMSYGSVQDCVGKT